jgi:hypothetical protein
VRCRCVSMCVCFCLDADKQTDDDDEFLALGSEILSVNESAFAGRASETRLH